MHTSPTWDCSFGYLFMDWFKPSRCELENRDRLTPFFTPELGYELLNFGGEVSYINRVQGDPLPRIGKLHFGTDAWAGYSF